ncbi:MAG: hypothetical protein ACPG7F_15585 [Aggregatilineales bacterium]
MTETITTMTQQPQRSDTPEQTEIPPAEALMPFLNFTPDDLIANRAGQIGEMQQEHLKRAQQRVVLFGVGGFYALAFVGTVFLFMGAQNESAILSLVGVLIVVLNGLLVGLLGRQYMRLRADLRSGTVDIVAGTMERVVQSGRQINNYLLRVNDVEIAAFKMASSGELPNGDVMFLVKLNSRDVISATTF